MKSFVNPFTRVSALLAVAGLLAASQALAADIFKAANVNALNVGTSWYTNVPPTQNIPGASDIAVWSLTTGNPTAAQCRNAPLGASASWAGIRLEAPRGSVIITNSSPQQLTLGASGISIASGTSDLILGFNVTVDLGASQTWDALSDSILITNVLSGAWGKDLTIVNPSGTASSFGKVRLQAANTFSGQVFHSGGYLYLAAVPMVGRP